MLKTAMVFIQKPIIMMQHRDVSYIEFQRCGQLAGGSSKSFDIEVVRRESEAHQFKNIDKMEYQVLISYFRKAGLKMRQRNAETGEILDLADLGSDEIDEEIRQSQPEPQVEEKDPSGGRGRRKAAVVAMRRAKAENDSDLDDDESDGSFNDQQSSSDEEDGEAEFDEDMEDEPEDDDLDLEEEKPKKKKK